MEGCTHTRRNIIIAILLIAVLVLIGYIYIMMKGVSALMNKLNDGVVEMLQGYWHMVDVPGRYILIKGASVRVIDISNTPSLSFSTEFSTDDATFTRPKLVSGKYEITMKFGTSPIKKLLLANPSVITISPIDGTMTCNDIKLVRDNEMSLEVKDYQ